MIAAWRFQPILPRRLYAWDLAHKMLPGPASPLVVCVDESMAAGGRLRIEGALPIQEFEAMQDSIPKDRELVFYSSSTEDTKAVERVIKYQDRGHSRVSFLEGGIHAWDSIVPFLAGNRSAPSG